MKIDLVAWGDDIPGLSLKSTNAKDKVTALGFRYSDSLSYSGPAIMEIYQSGGGEVAAVPEPSEEDAAHQLMPLIEDVPESDPGASAKPKSGLALELEKRREKSPGLVALAALPENGCRRATVLLGPAGSGTFTAYVIDDDPARLPPGQLRVHNLSPLPIALRCNGNQKKELKTRETFLVPARNGQVIYELAYKTGDRWKIQENNVIAVGAGDQTQLIILKSDNTFFRSSDGSTGGFLQVVALRRGPEAP